MIATCNVCREFSVPWDSIGVALMEQHLKDHDREEKQDVAKRRSS